jgi:hypothetical protein
MNALLATLMLSTYLLYGCASTNEHVLDMGDETQLQKRSYQSRVFDTADKEKVLRATISTLQDLGFIIDRADLTLGSVSGTKLDLNQVVKITVSVRPKGNDRMLVRANAQFNITPVEDPKQYQNFFTSLEKSLFLTAHAGE